MWDELENYRPIPFCSCAIPCSCGAIASVKMYREQDYVIRFLKGLSEKFAQSKSQIMMMNPLPDINKAFSLVIQQEREMDSVASSVVAPAGSAEDASALQVQAHEGNYASKQGTSSSHPRNQNSNAQRSNNRVCTHCGRNNHNVETCFIKHGYPPGFRNKAKSQGISTAAANTDSTSSASPQGSTTPSFGFTKEQYDNI